MYFGVKLRTFQGFYIPFWFGVGQVQKTELSSHLKILSSLWVEVQCSKILGIFSDVSSQTNPIFSIAIVLGFYMEYFEIRAFLIFHEYIQKIILFEISPI